MRFGMNSVPVLGLALAICAVGCPDNTGSSKSAMPEGFRDLNFGMTEESFITQIAKDSKYKNSRLRFSCRLGVNSLKELPRDQHKAAAAIQECRHSLFEAGSLPSQALVVELAPAPPFTELHAELVGEEGLRSIRFRLDANDDYTLTELLKRARSKLAPANETHKTLSPPGCRKTDIYEWSSCDYEVHYGIWRLSECPPEGRSGITISIFSLIDPPECRQRKVAMKAPKL